MKLPRPLCTFLLCLWSPLLWAQDAPLPSPETRPSVLPSSSSPEASPAPASTPAPPLIPADLLAAPTNPAPLPEVPAIPQLDEAFNQPPIDPAVEQQRKHIEWRRLRNQIRNDPGLKAALRAAEGAPTDLTRRKLLEDYYNLAYRKMAALASSDMTAYLVDRKKEALSALPQPRVRPESGVRVPETPAATVAATPVPTPSPKGAARFRP